MRWVVVFVALAACISDPTVPCDNGITCPAGDTCTPIGCALPSDVAKCKGMGIADGDYCDNGMGACLGGACHPIVCGDGLVDPGEACDDSNTNDGDGCSADCKSNETCGNGVVDPIVHEQCDDGNTLSNDGCSSTCGLERPNWQDVTPVPIEARAGTMMVYSQKLHRTTIFGGYGAATYLGDTWTSVDGKSWIKLNPIASPPARSNGVMTNDPIANRLLLFGGEGPGGLLGDTWVFNGVDWQRLHPAHSPSPRAWASIALDTTRNVAVLYGGADAQFRRLNDTWEWNGTDWTEVTPMGVRPPPDQGHSMAYDSMRHFVVMWTTTQEVWEYDGLKWMPRPFATKPLSMGYSAMAYDATIQRTLMFGGYTNNGNAVTADYVAWDGSDWTRLPALGPSARADLPMAYVPSQQNPGIVVFGGTTGRALFADSWAYIGGAWTSVPIVQNGPTARHLAASAYFPDVGVTMMFGGQDDQNGALGDLWRWDGFSWSGAAILPGGAPTARWGAAAVYDTAIHGIVLFGGADPTPQNDTWILDHNGFHSVGPASGPSPRSLHSMAYDSARQRVILFGGQTGPATLVADTWAYDNGWTQIPTSAGPGPRGSSAMAYDPLRDRVVLFGGYDSNVPLDDTWELDGTTWKEVSPPVSPPARAKAGMMYDPMRKRVVMFGGESQVIFADTWEWDGTNWTPIATDTSPPARAGMVMIYDDIERRGVWFGGKSLLRSLAADTWQLGYRSSKQEERCLLAHVDDDGDKLAGCDDPDCWGRCNPDCPPGTSCMAGEPNCGDGSCSPVEDSLICPEDCP